MSANPSKVQMVDPWFWAHTNKIRLVGGPFQMEGHEYQVDILQCTAKRQCARKATQMAFTETFVLKTLHRLRYGYYPLGVLYLFPTSDDVTDFSTSRFKPLIKDNPRSIGQFVRDTDRANLKRIGDGYLYFRGARLTQEIMGKKTSTKLKAIPVDAIICDERDEMPDQAILMAKGRMQHSKIKEEVYLGNPTRPDFGIDELYNNSDQRIWVLKCEKCGGETCLELEFPNCLERLSDGKVIRLCPHCRDRELYPRNGRWIAQYPEKTEEMVGWWISHLNSAYVDPKDLLDAWENPNTNKQEFYNLNLGMGYIEAESKLNEKQIYNLCGLDPMVMTHPGPTAMGVDVGKLLHVTVGYRPTESSIAAVYMARVSSWNDVHDIAKRLNVQSAVIDSEPELHKAREFQEAEPYEIFLCQYYEKQRKSPAFDSNDGMVKINRTEICDATHDLVVKPGRYAIPRRSKEIEQYAKEMCNTVKVLKVDDETNSRQYVYVSQGSGKPDHYRHSTNYMLLASMRIPVFVEQETYVPRKDSWDSGFEDQDSSSNFMAM